MKQHFVVPPTEDSLQTFGVGTVIGGKFRLEEKIGQGSFGMIFKCISGGESQEVFAIKLEKRNQRHSSMLAREIKVLMEMNSDRGFAKMQMYGKDDDYNYIVMSYLGRNIDSLLKKCGGCFSMQTTINVAEQMISRLEALHNKNLIHRDIKPENYVIGYRSNFTLVYLIDFGLAKYYMESQGNHIPFIEKKGMIGTARYASINAHLGNEQSRRDDMEALGYLLLYLAKGKLPWQNINAETKDEKYEKIKAMKLQLTIEQLCEGLPQEFLQYFKHVKGLKFEEAPNYSMLRKLFAKIAVDRKIEHLVGTLDWEGLPDYRQRKKYQTVAPFMQKNASGQLEIPHSSKKHLQEKTTQPNAMMINSATQIGAPNAQKPLITQSPEKQVIKPNLGGMLGRSPGQYKIDQQHLLKLEDSVNQNNFQNFVISNGTSNTLQTATQANGILLSQQLQKHNSKNSNDQQLKQILPQQQQSDQVSSFVNQMQQSQQLQIPNGRIRFEEPQQQSPTISQSSKLLSVPYNEKASNSHSLLSGSGGGSTSKINNYLWSESDDITNEESIKIFDLISKDFISFNNPQAILQEIRIKSHQLKCNSFVEMNAQSDTLFANSKQSTLPTSLAQINSQFCENIVDGIQEQQRDIKVFQAKKAFSMKQKS